MGISKKDILHLTDLSRLDLTSEEVAKFGDELNDILIYVGKLGEVKTDGVAPMAHVSGQAARLREDEVSGTVPEEGLSLKIAERDACLKAFPERAGDLLAVKSIFAHRSKQKSE